MIKSILSNSFVLFDRPLASFKNNIIYIDRPNNLKTRHEVVCTIFCILKITSFHTSHKNFKTLPLPSKLQKTKREERLSQILEPLFFPTCFPASLLLSGKPMQAHTSGLSYQTKIYRTCATKCPSDDSCSIPRMCGKLDRSQSCAFTMTWLLTISYCLHHLNLFTALGSIETYVRIYLFRLWCSVDCRRRGKHSICYD